MCKENQNFFDQLIAHDEAKLHHYDPEIKVQSKHWKYFHSPLTKKALSHPRQARSIAVFWDQPEVVIME